MICDHRISVDFLVPVSLLLFLLLLFAAGPVAAQGNPPSFDLWLTEFRAEALAAGISEATLSSSLTGLKPLETILESDRNQPEFKRTLDEYLNNAINQIRVKKGRKHLRGNWRLFARLKKDFPVQSRFLVALWAIETDFGRNQGNVPVIQALVTLAYDPRRSSYFRKELMNALRILDQQSMSLDRMRGSWAGAMGQVQFMPSVFLQNALDYDNDGQIDIWQSRTDALASAANYLKRLGWQKGWTWGREVTLPADFDQTLHGLDYQLNLSEWQKLGVRKLDRTALPQAGIRASLIRPDGPSGRAFLVYANYRKLLNWNRSHNFAIAVGMLADQIGE